MSRILILGKGYIGSHLNAFLRKQNQVTWLSKLDVNYTSATHLCDFLSRSPIYDLIINASGYTGSPNVDACEDHKQETYFYNVFVTEQIQKACDTMGVYCVHIGSGCIYTQENPNVDFTVYNEYDPPNFGLYGNTSSFYSRMKHLSEIMLASNDERYCNYTVLRIRMPITFEVQEKESMTKNFFLKLTKYPKLLNAYNSKTSIELLVNTIQFIIDNPSSDIRKNPVINVVNDKALKTEEVIDVLKEIGMKIVEDQQFISLEEFNSINTRAKRSTCILSCDLLKRYIEVPTEREYYDKWLLNISNESKQ